MLVIDFRSDPSPTSICSFPSMCSFHCKKMERLLQGKIPSVLAFLHTMVHAAVKGLLARSDPSPKRFFKGRGSIMVVVRCGSCSYDKMNLALARLNTCLDYDE